jgi:carbamoyl-phosphate synthase large subunit
VIKIQIGGAGGAPSNNFIRSLRESSRAAHLIGMSCVPSDLFLADVDEKHVIPPASAPEYPAAILGLLEKTRPNFLHVQHDSEVLAISSLRNEIEALGVKLFLPSHQTIESCVDKYKSYAIWQKAGLKVPESLLVNTPADLRTAFERFGSKIWLRAITGGGGRGALPATDFDFARAWIDRFQGWGDFTASVHLTARTVTWLSIWYQGELVVAQSRARRSWHFGNRTLSGVTGVTGVGVTLSDPEVDRIAQEAIHMIDKTPHGIFGVDMTYDAAGVPNPTEINIGRFFTTHYFFTKAGLNMPEIYTDLALDQRMPKLAKRVNPLPDGLVWIRGMDIEPVLTTVEKLDEMERLLK